MNIKILAPLLFTALLVSASAFAEEGKVTISSPMNGATFGTNDDIKLDFSVLLGPNGNHLHLNVDGQREDIIRQTSGMEDVGTLPAGKHHICLAVNTASHVPTGVEGCIDVTVK